MSIPKILIAASLLAGATVALDARAQLSSVYTKNDHKKDIWITIYDLGKTRHLDYGCVSPGTVRQWQSGKYFFGSFYYVRAEVKDGANCGGRTLCDTTMQINPQWGKNVGNDPWKDLLVTGQRNAVALEPNGTNCYLKYLN
jgi:hypothetical protein